MGREAVLRAAALRAAAHGRNAGRARRARQRQKSWQERRKDQMAGIPSDGEVEAEGSASSESDGARGGGSPLPSEFSCLLAFYKPHHSLSSCLSAVQRAPRRAPDASGAGLGVPRRGAGVLVKYIRGDETKPTILFHFFFISSNRETCFSSVAFSKKSFANGKHRSLWLTASALGSSTNEPDSLRFFNNNYCCCCCCCCSSQLS